MGGGAGRRGVKGVGCSGALVREVEIEIYINQFCTLDAPATLITLRSTGSWNMPGCFISLSKLWCLWGAPPMTFP